MITINTAAVAAHGALVLLVPLMGLLAARRVSLRLVWPAAGLLALACASAAPAGSSARAILGIAAALAATAVAGGGSMVTSVVAACAFVSLAVAAALGVERFAGYTLCAVASALLVLATAALERQRAGARKRWLLATAAVAVSAPLLDFAGRWQMLAPWATLPHALALAGVVAWRREPVGADPALAARLERLERELGFTRSAGAVAIVAAAAVHELKGLLADLGLAAEYAAASQDPPARERALALMIDAVSDGKAKALRLLEDMQRADREPLSVCGVKEVLEEVARSCAAAVRPGSAPVVSIEAPADLAVETRRREIGLALSCLARNALGASARRGLPEVRLRACASAASLDIEVGDEAGGLPLDVRVGLFDAPPQPREGLGLVLAARLIEQNGGRLDYLSAEGRSSFRVSLPGRVDSADRALL